MRNVTIISFLLLLGLNGFGQTKSPKENIIYCLQYKTSLDYIKTDSNSLEYLNLKEMNFSIDDSIAQTGWAFIMSFNLVKFDLDLNLDQIKEMNKDSLLSICKKYEETDKAQWEVYQSPCLNSVEKSSSPNVSISFARFSGDLIIVKTRLIQKTSRMSRGYFYYFKFKDGNILRVNEEDYIE